MIEIVRFDSPCEPEISTPASDRWLGGTPRHTLQNFFTDTSGQFFCGRWASTPGKWRVAYTENEFCHLTRGHILLIGQDGREARFGPGESFVVPAGFAGTWEVLEDCEKVYAIFASSAPA